MEHKEGMDLVELYRDFDARCATSLDEFKNAREDVYKRQVKPVKMGDLASITGEDEKGTGRNFDCKRQEEVTGQ